MAELVLLGVLLAAIFYEATDINPGGIVVPGIMALYLGQPLRILYTVAVALLAWALVRLAAKKFLVFGKRRFVLLIILSFLLHLLFNWILGFFFESFSFTVVSLVGYTATGVLANNIYKQGPVRTVGALAVVVGILLLVVLLLSAWGVSL